MHVNVNDRWGKGGKGDGRQESGVRGQGSGDGGRGTGDGRWETGVSGQGSGDGGSSLKVKK